MKILKSYSETEAYINLVREYADLNKHSFGFLPASVYEEFALTERLWVLVSNEKTDMHGYLIFGGSYPTLRVIQLFVVEKHRKSGVAKRLINELIKHGETNNYSSIRAKVATELPANHFWEKNKFLITKQELGGTTTSKMRRKINHRSYTLDTPDLFKEAVEKNSIPISYPDKPLFSLPVFTIDLNVLYDITRERKNSDKAKQILEYGLTGAYKLCLTPEFKVELERTQTDRRNDPIYEFAKAFPTLDKLSGEILTPLTKEIRKCVFPDRSMTNRTANNDASDLLHLAYCSYNKVGFITSEKSILRQSTILKEKYGIAVVSPAEIDFGEPNNESLLVSSDNNVLVITKTYPDVFSKIDSFLKNIGVDGSSIKSIRSRKQGVSRTSEYIASIGTEVIGFCSWNIPNSLNPQIDCYLYVDETNINAVRVIDHFIEKSVRDSCINTVTRIDLHIEQKQSLTKSTAKKKGYISTNNNNLLTKIALNGYLLKDNWEEFIYNYSVLTKRKFPSKIPKPKDLINTGIRVQEKDKIHSNCLSLFMFESIISPGIILYETRSCLLIPIKEQYANDLLGFRNPQQSLFPSKSNCLLLEKAYFRKTPKSSYFKKGGLIAFYVSGNKSRQEIIGTARITYSNELSLEQIHLNISKQGVLSKGDLKQMLNKQGKLHVFTFDNFKEFPNKVSFKVAKSLELISGANLVTVERLPFAKLKLLMETAYCQ